MAPDGTPIIKAEEPRVAVLASDTPYDPLNDDPTPALPPVSDRPTAAEFLPRLSLLTFAGMSLASMVSLFSNGKTKESNTNADVFLIPIVAFFLATTYSYYTKHYSSDCKSSFPFLDIYHDPKSNPGPNDAKTVKDPLRYGGMYAALLAGHTSVALELSTFFTAFWNHGGFALSAASGFIAGEALDAIYAKETENLASPAMVFLPASVLLFCFISFNNIAGLPDTYTSGSDFDFIAPAMTLGLSFTVANGFKLHSDFLFRTSIAMLRLTGDDQTADALSQHYDLAEGFREAAKWPLILAYTTLALGQIAATRIDDSPASTFWKDGGYALGTAAAAGAGIFGHYASKALKQEPTPEYDIESTGYSLHAPGN